MSKKKINLKETAAKFKDSKLFATIKNVAPTALDMIGDAAAVIYPPIGGPINAAIDLALNVAVKNGDTKGAKQLMEAKDEYVNELTIHMANTADAREMYRSTGHEMADKIAENVIKYNLIIILVMVCIQVGVIMLVAGPIAAVITGVVGTITGALIAERNTVINFFFGSSQGSKDKD